jgi:hypothetical protein
MLEIRLFMEIKTHQLYINLLSQLGGPLLTIFFEDFSLVSVNIKQLNYF